MVIRRIHVWSVARVFGLLYGTLALFPAAMLAFAGVAHAHDGHPLLLALGSMAMFVLPVLYGFMGMLAGALVAALYNLSARFMGGIVVEVDEV